MNSNDSEKNETVNESIQKIDTPHNEAMDLYEKGIVLEFDQGEMSEDALALFSQSFELENQSLRLFKEKGGSEPMLSVLLASAATIAFSCRKYVEAEKFIVECLSGNPPDTIRQELLGLRERITIKLGLQ